ncbi:MAG: hypothetical protein ABSE73_12910 [Planctomycetota bacterium]
MSLWLVEAVWVLGTGFGEVHQTRGGERSFWEEIKMAKPFAFVVVGHSNWGKSWTLKALTGGSWHRKRVRIKGHDFFIRRMSNDDDPKPPNEADRQSLLDFARKEKGFRPVILALCPAFQEEKTAQLLDVLREKFTLKFWVMKKKFGESDKVVTCEEIGKLRTYGIVEVFAEEVEANSRAAALRHFIDQNLA